MGRLEHLAGVEGVVVGVVVGEASGYLAEDLSGGGGVFSLPGRFRGGGEG